jgi:putative glutamine amidotransferase
MAETTLHDLRTVRERPNTENQEPERMMQADQDRTSAPPRITGPRSRRPRRPPDTLKQSQEREPADSRAGQTPRRTTRRARPSRKPSAAGGAQAPRGASPVIGITCSLQRFPTRDRHDSGYFYLYEPYVAAIHEGGGIPIIIPIGLGGRYPARIFELLNGLVLSGGGDVDPNRYGDILTTALKMVEPKKDQTEIDLFNLAFNKNIPVLGICRGAQIMNVALDGTLYQDVTGQVRMALNHDPDFPHEEPSHEVRIERDSKLYKALGESSIWVNSWHHQAMKLHGKGLLVSARASDGVIEAIEHPNKKWVIGVQWHPELMWQSDKTQAKLFKVFVDACKS